MKYIKCLLPTVLAFILAITISAQNLPVWVSLEAVTTKAKNHNIPFYVESYSNDTNIKIPTYVKDFHLSSMICSVSKKPVFGLKNKLFGLIGKIDQMYVMFIDTNMDLEFQDSEMIVLPTLSIDEGFDYDVRFLYPTAVSKDIVVNYDYIANGGVNNISASINISISAKYDSVYHELKYINEFSAGFNTTLIAKNIFGNTESTLSIEDRFPWNTIFRFILTTDSVSQVLNMGDTFQSGKSGPRLKIIDFDVINKKILLLQTEEAEKTISIGGYSIADSIYLSTDSLKGKIRVIHFWGSWCAPCLKNLPLLKIMKDSNKDLAMIGVCVDSNKESSRKVITKLGIKWDQIYFDSEANFENKFKIALTQFPTYFLFDKDDKLVGKFDNIESLKLSLESIQR